LYLVAANLDADLDADWDGRSVDAGGHREQQQREPDDEQQDEQDQAAEAILGQRGPRTTTRRWQRLKQDNKWPK